eukprot:TRINITY_DN2951_c0_g1_i4.p1 TRINITY_DN2951_c0_g1~~TRINITY_DN2951_c0_g1_i4.p1  ORF type:complete len:411 (-),score=74.33 TRINITY_DN2951_c0_g1_i4:7-1239(-)
MCVSVQPTSHGSGAKPITPFIGYVNNKCPECATGDLDLGMAGDGRWGIEWKAIECPFTNPVSYRFEGSNAHYLKMQVRLALIPFDSVSVWNPSQSSWISMSRTDDNHWLVSNPQGLYPLSTNIRVRIVGVTGEVIEDSVAWVPAGIIAGSAQFTPSGTSLTSATGTPSSATSSQPSDSTTSSSPSSSSSGLTSLLGAVTSSVSTVLSSGGGGGGGGSISSDLPVYQNSLNPAFENWSWAVTNFSNPSPVHSAPSSISFIPGASYDAFYVHCVSSSPCIYTSSSGYAGLEFYIHGGAEGGQAIDVAVVQYDRATEKSAIIKSFPVATVLGKPIPANAWTKGYIDFSDVPAGAYDGLWFQSKSSSGVQGVVYLDDIRLVARPSTPPNQVATATSLHTSCAVLLFLAIIVLFI